MNEWMSSIWKRDRRLRTSHQGSCHAEFRVELQVLEHQLLCAIAVALIAVVRLALSSLVSICDDVFVSFLCTSVP